MNNKEIKSNDTKLVLGDVISKIEKLIKEEEKFNPKQLDECSWGYQVGILLTTNEAKLLLASIYQMGQKIN